MVDKGDSFNLLPAFNPAFADGKSEPKPEGVNLDELAKGAVLEIQTGHHAYRLENLGDGNALISGHPTYCPKPVRVEVEGSIDGAGYLKWRFIGKGMYLAFVPPDHAIIRTSRIQDIRTLTPAPSSN